MSWLVTQGFQFLLASLNSSPNKMFFCKLIAQQITFLVASPHNSADGRRREGKSNSMPWDPGCFSDLEITSVICNHSGHLVLLKSLCLPLAFALSTVKLRKSRRLNSVLQIRDGKETGYAWIKQDHLPSLMCRCFSLRNATSFFAGDTHTSPSLTGDDNEGDKQLELMQLDLIFVCHHHQEKPQQ